MITAFIGDPEDWASANFEHSTLPDDRLVERLTMYAMAQVRDPTGSTSAACTGDAAAREGAYRLIENDRVQASDIEDGPMTYTAELCATRDAVLLIQDTTSVAVRHAPLAESVKSLGSPTGFLAHNTLAVDPNSGEVLGLIGQHRWLREKAADTDKGFQGKPKPYEERESARWERALQESHDRLDGRSRPITVADREGDITEFIAAHKELDADFVIRASADRRLTGERSHSHLWEHLENQPVLGTYEVIIEQRGAQPAKGIEKGRPARPRRTATVTVRSATVTLKASKSRLPDDVDCLEVNAVLVREEKAPADVEPIEWMLLTSEPVATLEQGLWVIHCYELRWLIEEFHRCWKSGTNLESRPLQSLEAVERIMVILAPVGVRLLQLQNLANQRDENVPCDQVLKEDEWMCLWASTENDPKPIPKRVPSARWAWLAIARLGGWYDTKKTGRVGWTTAWKGWHKLQERLIGWRAAQSIL